MRTKKAVVPIAALTLALSSFSAKAAEQGERHSRGSQRQSQSHDEKRGDASAAQRSHQENHDRASADRSGQQGERGNRGSQSQDQGRQRTSAPAQARESQGDRSRSSASRDAQRSPEVAGRNSRGDSRDSRESRDIGRSRSFDPRRDYDRGRSFERGSYSGGYSRSYYAPRLLPRRSGLRHYYGSGGHLSLYFGLGSGYLYGSPYSGRVYGYRGRGPSYGSYQSYGDVRLRVSPRDAAVYVDGYYAGIVDDFDGFFQRLTLEVGPHEIEIEAPGIDSQVFDVYVDPSRTVDLRADLVR